MAPWIKPLYGIFDRCKQMMIINMLSKHFWSQHGLITFQSFNDINDVSLSLLLNMAARERLHWLVKQIIREH